MALSATLNTLKDRLQLFSSEADTLSALCSSSLNSEPREWTPSLAVSKGARQTMRPPPALRPRLPTEILDNIFSYLEIKHLKPLLVTNSYTSTIATRRLYHDVILIRAVNIVAFLRTILANERLQSYVRSLDINVTKCRTRLTDPSSMASSKAMLTLNFYALLQRALRVMVGLTSLNIELPKTHTPLWIFEGCTFRLRQFTTSMYCRRPLARFLETQDNIEELTLRGYQTDAIMFLPFIETIHGSPAIPEEEVFILREGALPRLRAFNAVHADAKLVKAVVMGRPVDVVSIPLFPDMSVASLDALSASSVPLRRLSVISFDPTAPGFLFKALAKRFEDLEALHLVMLMAEYNQELLEESGITLSKFKCLKYITFMAAPTRPPVAPVPTAAPAAAPGTAANPPTLAQSASNSSAMSTDSTDSLDDAELDNATDEAGIAQHWHRHCPTLRTIILPKGRVWFQNGPSGPSGAGSSSAAGTGTGIGATPTLTPPSTSTSGSSVGSAATGIEMPALSISMENGVSEIEVVETNGGGGEEDLTEAGSSGEWAVL